jgi:hypothetical protein
MSREEEFSLAAGLISFLENQRERLPWDPHAFELDLDYVVIPPRSRSCRHRRL